MVDRIKQLEKLSQSLEPNAGERAFLLDKVTQYTNAFLENINTVPAYQATHDEGIGLYDSPISEEPIDIDTALNLIKQNVDRPGVNVGSGGYLCFIPGSGLYYSALGDYIAAVTNRYAGVFFASPGAVRMEKMLLRWMANFIGYPESASGDLTSGGSIANLAGIVTAREAFDLKAKDFERNRAIRFHDHRSAQRIISAVWDRRCAR